MTSLLGDLMSRVSPRAESGYYPSVTYNGVTYPLSMPQTTLGFTEEMIAPSYASIATLAYQANPVVYACVEMRRAIFSQARFQWQQVRGGTPGQLFGTADLALLEHPEPGVTTGDLLARALLDADLAGNGFILRRDGQLTRLRPDWVEIIAADRGGQGAAALDAVKLGYLYHPGGKYMGAEPELLLREEVAHFAPTPDPMARWRGWSWVNTVIREVMGDQAATTHKLKYFENGATSNVVVKFDPAIVNTLEKFDAWVEKLDQQHKGVANAYKTWYLGAGADPTVLGDNLRQVDFKVTQGAGETRIAAGASVPPILVGLSEGLASATYSNYGMARRRFSDGTIWPLWGNIAGSLEVILPPPAGARLWVDGRHIPFLQEDEKDRAEIQQMDMSAIATGVTAGYEPDSVVDAVTSGDLTRLVHSGMYSVQLRAPGTQQSPEPAVGPPERAIVAQARAHLIESGVKPTVAAIAESLAISEATARRWRDA